ncbi:MULTISPECIES: hypothetical protein [Psychrobacillus]|nr:hypothetical protein [Psychrobacillus faecigallinarum]
MSVLYVLLTTVTLSFSFCLIEVDKRLARLEKVREGADMYEK